MLQASGNLKSELSNAILIQDSLNKELLNNKTEIEFMKEQLSKIQLDIAEDKLIEKSDSLTRDMEKLTSDSSNSSPFWHSPSSLKYQIINRFVLWELIFF